MLSFSNAEVSIGVIIPLCLKRFLTVSDEVLPKLSYFQPIYHLFSYDDQGNYLPKAKVDSKKKNSRAHISWTYQGKYFHEFKGKFMDFRWAMLSLFHRYYLKILMVFI